MKLKTPNPITRNAAAVFLMAGIALAGCQKEPTPYHEGAVGPGPAYKLNEDTTGLREESGEPGSLAGEDPSLGPPPRTIIPNQDAQVEPDDSPETFGSAAGRTYNEPAAKNYNEDLKPESYEEYEHSEFQE